MAKNILPSISVIIPCHNYAHFLGDCLQSIIGQTYRPQEIIVVDDASTDEPNKIVEDFKYSDLRLIRVEHRSLVKSQREGILNANGEIVCCIDADDMIDPFYIQRGVETFLEDYRIGVVYSDMEFVGLMKGKTSFPESSLKYDIQRNNYIHSGSLVRREVALLTDAFEHPSLGDYTVDWFTWRKLLKAGYWAVKQPQRYIYRRHEESYSITRHWRPKEIPGYYESAALSEESITIALLANPTVQGWEKQRKFLEEQTWPKDKTSIFLICIAKDAKLVDKIKRELFALGYNDLRFHLEDSYSSLGVTEREHAIMHLLSSEVENNYFIYVDQHISPPLNVVEKLLREMCENTASVCTDLPIDAWQVLSLKYRGGKPVRATSGVHRTFSNAFCCVLFRLNQFRRIFQQANDEPSSVKTSPENYFQKNLEVPFVTKINCDLLSKVEIVPPCEDQVDPDSFQKYFDETYYLENNPDVREAVNSGEYKSGFAHFLQYGKNEGRAFRGHDQVFDEDFYLKNNPDVLEALIQGTYSSGFEHYQKNGRREGRLAYFY